MTSFPNLLTFYLASLLLILSPGPDMLLIIARGIGQGRRVAMLTTIGVTLVAALVQLPLLAFGVAALVEQSPSLFAALKWGGALYLIWLGVRCIRRANQQNLASLSAPQVSDWSALRDGAINNLTNPKPLLFLLTFLPQFVDPAASYPPVVQLLILGAMLKLSSFVLMSVVALGAGGIGSVAARHTGLLVWQQRFTGMVMIGLGLRLVWPEGR